MNIDLEDILLKSHTISYIRSGECDWPDELSCQCGWDGSPRDYGKHLLLVLGFTKTVLDEWFGSYVRYIIPEQLTEKQIEDYLNMYRGPEDKRSFGLTKSEWDKLDKTSKKETKKSSPMLKRTPFAENPGYKSDIEFAPEN